MKFPGKPTVSLVENSWFVLQIEVSDRQQTNSKNFFLVIRLVKYKARIKLEDVSLQFAKAYMLVFLYSLAYTFKLDPVRNFTLILGHYFLYIHSDH